MQLGFSSDNFERTDKQFSGSSLLGSNWQKVQLNTDLLKHNCRYLYRKVGMNKMVNEIKSIIEKGEMHF